jgi:hypothetical protein
VRGKCTRYLELHKLKTPWLVRYRWTVNKNRFLKPPGFLGHVVAISSESDVHILEWSTNGNVKKLFSWNTGAPGPDRPMETGSWIRIGMSRRVARFHFCQRVYGQRNDRE